MNWIPFLPAFFLLIIWPCLVHLDATRTGLEQMAWFPDVSVQDDYFMHAKAVVLILLAVWMLAVLIDRIVLQRGKRIRLRFALPFLAYLFLAGVSAVFSVNPSFSFTIKTEQAETLWVLTAYFIVFWYFYDTVVHYECAERFLDYMLTGAFFQTLIGLSQMAGADFWSTPVGQFLIQLGSGDVQRLQFRFAQKKQVYLSFYNPNYAAVYLVLMLSVSVCASIWIYREKKKRLAAAALSILMLVCMWGTKSEAGILTVILLIIPGGFMKLKTVKKRILWGTGAAGVLLACGLVSVILPDHPVSQKIIKNIFPKQRTYPLESIVPGEDEIVVTYNKQKYYLRLEEEDGRCWFSVREEDGALCRLNYKKKKDLFYLEDYSYKKLSFSAAKAGNTYQITVHRKNVEYLFRKESQDEPYRYITVYGKPDEIEAAPSAFWHGYEKAFSDRGYIWSRTIPLLKNYLLTGSGPNTFALVFPQKDYVMRGNLGMNMLTQIISRPHNFYLQTAIQTGLLSLCIFMAVIANYFRIALKCRNNISMACVLAVIGFLIMGFTNDSLVVTSPFFWAIFGMGYGVARKN